MKMIKGLNKNKGIVIVCLIYFVISLALFFVIKRGNANVYGDSPGYIRLAETLLSSAFFSVDGIDANFLRTPGYPLFLAAIYFLGGGNASVVIVQILLMTITIFLFYRILIMLRTPKYLSLFGSALLLCNVQSYSYSICILTESIFLFFLILSMFFLIGHISCGKKRWWFLFFSVSLNYAMFVRPILVYFNMLICLMLLIAFIIKKVKFNNFIMFSLCFFLIWGGWSLRNYLHSGVFVFSTIQKNNMVNHYAPIVSAGSEYMKTHDIIGFIEGATDYHRELFLQEYPEAANGNLNEAQISILKGKYGTKFIKGHFPEYIKVNITGFIKMMFTPFPSALLAAETSSSLSKKMLIDAAKLLYGIYINMIYALYIIGLFISFKKRDAVHIGIFLLCGYLAIPGAIFASPRFRSPFFPLLLLSAVSNSRIIIEWLDHKLQNPVLSRIRQFLLEDR